MHHNMSNNNIILYSRIILTTNGIERSVRKWDCICDADTAVFEFICPQPHCGLFQRPITDIVNECRVHRKDDETLTMCGGGNVEMCTACTSAGYKASNATGGGIMSITNKEANTRVEYCPKYVPHPCFGDQTESDDETDDD